MATVTVQEASMTIPARATDTLPARLLSLGLALFLSGAILLYPKGVADVGHGLLALVMWGISAGFVHGVGFVPESRVWRVGLGPWTAWILMGLGLWFFLRFSVG
jgi:predicted membrane protein